MMISQPALLCLESTWRRILGRPVADVAPELAPGVPRAMVAAVAAPGGGTSLGRPAEHAVRAPAESDLDLVPKPVPAAPLTVAERRARAAALRALALSRGRRFEAARAAFIEASRLDPTLDLTRTPAFWKLERSAHEAAIDAYQETGRDGDAAILRARVRSTYRPKALRPRPDPVLSS